MPESLPGPDSPQGGCRVNQGTPGLVITWVLLIVGILVVFLRLYVRLRIRRNAGWDDLMAVAGLVIGVISGGFFTKMITSGMGRHVSCLPPQTVVSMLEFSAISEALNVIGIGVVKICVCLTLLRVVERARKAISRFLWALIIFIAATHLAFALLLFLHCRPLSALWNPRVKGSCMLTPTTVLVGYVGFAIDIVTDLVCAAVPILVIRKLQMNTREKVVLCILMGLGIFTAGCAVAKAITLRGVFADDYTWGFTKPATWAAAEQFVGIIIVSVPALRPFFASFRERSRKSSEASKESRKYKFRRNTSEPMSDQSADPKQSRQSHRVSLADRIREKARSQRLWYRTSSFDDDDDDDDGTVAASGSPTSTVVETVRESSWAKDPDLEKGQVMFKEKGEDGFYPGQDGNLNFLHEWALPNIGDRRSGIFAIPHLHHSVRYSNRYSGYFI